MSNVIYKMFQTKATSIDEENFDITFKISDGTIDRQGEIVSQKDWQLDNYMANPVLLFGHDPSRPQFVLGKCLSIEYNPGEDCHYGTFHLDAGFNPDALLVWNQLVAGTLRTVSLGFITHSLEYEEDVPVLSGVEPVETSIVPIPANANALAKAHKAGRVNEKDAKFLIKTMRDEADSLEKQLVVTQKIKENKKSMSPEQAQALIDGQTKTTEALTALTEKVETLTTENAELKAQVEALKPAAETEEEKTARETKEADEKKAAEEAEAAEAKKAEEEAAAKKAAEDEEAKKNPAKSGDADQDGAGNTDELDEDAELTPKLQAQIDAEVEALVA